MKIDYSIVIPVYKSKESLKILAKKVDELFKIKLSDKKYELIFVNDSPSDTETCDALKQILEEYNSIKVIEFTQNFGQQSALLCGIDFSVGEYIITMDDDLQHDPNDILELIKEQSHDIVVAKFKRKKHNFFKRITSSIKGYCDYIILGKPKSIQLTSYRLFNRVIADNMLKIGTSYPFIPALLFSVSKDVVNVDVQHYERVEGKSNYTLKKMIQLFGNLLINNSSLLLKCIGYFGLLSASGSLAYSGYIIYKALFYDVAAQGWSSLMVAILFFGGMMMFTVGILGEYLVRIIHTSENRPHYFVRKIRHNRES